MRDCVDEYEGTPPAEFEFNEPCEVEDDGLPPRRPSLGYQRVDRGPTGAGV